MSSQQSSRDSWDGDGVDLTATGRVVFCVSPHRLGLSQPTGYGSGGRVGTLNSEFVSTLCPWHYRACICFLEFGELSSCSVMTLPVC